MRCRVAAIALLFSAIALSACEDDEAGQATLRMVHASPDAPNVDVIVGTLQVLTDVPFFTASAYVDIAAGEQNVRIEAVGTDTPLIDATLPLDDGDAATVLIVDSLASIEPMFLDDDLSAPPAGQFKVRAVHASPATGTIDLYVFPAASPLPGAPSVADVEYKTASAYVTVPVGQYRLVVTPANDPGTLAVDLTLTFAEGEIRTLIARDNAAAPEGVSVEVVEDN